MRRVAVRRTRCALSLTFLWTALPGLLAMPANGFERAAALAESSIPQPAQQEPAEPAPQPPSPAAGPRVTVRGVVKNAASGEPLPRALVRIEGDAAAGALTDGDGHFEIPGVPVGPQAFQIVKPGFRDVLETADRAVLPAGATSADHNVHVTSGMEDLEFAMSPTNSIRGQIELSTGDPAQGIGVMLLRRAVQDGRAVWQAGANTRTNSDGAFRFAGLADGTYAIYTEPAMDTDLPVNLVEAGRARQITRAGYPSLFYPEARDIAGAGKIQLAAGQQAQANLLLPQEPFHLVRATVMTAGAGQSTRDEQSSNVSVMVLDAQGHQLPYGAEYDRPSHAVQAFLPDGTYSFLVTAINPIQSALRVNLGGSGTQRFIRPAEAGRQLTGEATFSVSGRSLTNLRLALGPEQIGTVQVSLLRTNTQQAPQPNVQPGPIVVMLSQAGGWITDGMVTSFAEGYPAGPIETTPMAPGTYWTHISIPQKSFCEASFTAGGGNLAREPLVLGLAGPAVPLTLTLRDDCASLKLSLPPALELPVAGDEPFYTVYLVPDFDSTVDITPITLRPSSGGSITVDGLTPGSYHVYAFASPVELEYRNPDAMAQLPESGQVVTLAPSGTATLTVEIPKR